MEELYFDINLDKWISVIFILSVPSGISDHFRCLLSLTSASCWKLTAVLANVFAAQIVPPGTYNLLKLCLLMGLVQTSDGNRDPQDCLDILIITTDTLLVDSSGEQKHHSVHPRKEVWG